MKHLLPQVPRYFKTNLHTHTNVSDGDHSPEEVKEFYKSRGYSAVAFTDHEVCIAHEDLCDPDFLALTSYELGTNDTRDTSIPIAYRKTYHLNFLSLEPDNRWQVHDSSRCWGNALKYIDQMVIDGNEHWEYDTGDINDIIARANAHGFLVTYNHPVWSCQDYTDYAPLKGLWATEVYNAECCRSGYSDDQDKVFQDLLCLGNRVFPVAADDFHYLRSEQCIGQGWVMVAAEELSYPAMAKALKNGDFYASTGPALEEVSVEDQTLTVRCSAASSVRIITNCRYCKRVFGEDLTEAKFNLEPWLNLVEKAGDPNAFVRVVVTDKAGKKAYTRPYYLNEM